MIIEILAKTNSSDMAANESRRNGHSWRMKEVTTAMQAYWKATREKLRCSSWTDVLRRLLASLSFSGVEIAQKKYGPVSLAVSAVVLTGVVLLAGAAPALAQDAGGGGGDAIQQTLTNVRNYLATLSFAVGGIGFVASLLVKGYASINENAHAYAAMGMKGSLWCIVAGVIVTPILSIAAGLAGGGG